jgi:acetyl-CoA carboxylase biotin carboxyl carrier protein
MASFEAKSEVSGSIWQIVTKVGEAVEPGGTIMIIESMKMEIPVICEDGGTVQKFLVEEKDTVNEGQVVAILSK